MRILKLTIPRPSGVQIPEVTSQNFEYSHGDSEVLHILSGYLRYGGVHSPDSKSNEAQVTAFERHGRI